jgi:transcriptional regulator with XRE-family HTH domain
MPQPLLPQDITFGERLRELRKARGRTQREVADAIQVDFTYLSKMEKAGGLIPAAKKIDEIATFLGLSDAERDDLYRLAEKIPDELEQMLVREPEAANFYRAVNRMDDARRRAFLRDLVEKLEREQQGETEGPYRGDDPGRATEDDR